MATGWSLRSFAVFAKDPARTRRLHELVGIETPVDRDEHDGFFAQFTTPGGIIELGDTTPTKDTPS